MALSPYSPKAKEEPRCAVPRRRPFCCFRNFTFFGSSIFFESQRFNRRVLPRSDFLSPQHRLLLLFFFGQNLTAKNPRFDADDAVGRAGLCKTVTDIGAQGVQRHSPFTIPFGARDFRSAQSTRALDSHALGPHTHGPRDAFFHGTPERNPAFQLQS